MILFILITERVKENMMDSKGDFFLLIPDGVYGLSAIGFEGYEKRLEVSFFEPSIFQYSKGLGLCALTKRNTHLHACKIVSPFYNDI
ncbi:hypothetical protein Bca4012_007078 [Brassica carinata]